MPVWGSARGWSGWSLSGCSSQEGRLVIGIGTDFWDDSSLTFDPASPQNGYGGTMAWYRSGAPSICLVSGTSGGDAKCRIRDWTGRYSSEMGMGPAVRLTDVDNYYTVLPHKGNDALSLYKTVLGTITVLATTAQLYGNAEDLELELAVVGTSLDAEDVTNAITVSVTDSDIASGTGCGIRDAAGNFHSTRWFLEIIGTSGTATSPSLDRGAGWAGNVLVAWDEDLTYGDITVDVQQSSDDGVADPWTDVETGLTDPSGDLVAVTERYVRIVVTMTRSAAELSNAQNPELVGIGLFDTSLTEGAAGGQVTAVHAGVHMIGAS